MPRTLLILSTLIGLGFMALVNSNQADPPAVQKKLLRHVVLFKFKADATADQIRQVEQAFAALPGQIPVIRDFEWGVNNSPEGLDLGYTHCFLVTFGSEEDRAAYLPHPAHQKFVEVLKPVLDQVHVIDYWASK